MAKRLVCVLNVEREQINHATLNCGDRSHEHVSRAEAIIKVKDNEAEWIKEPAHGKEKGIIRVLKGSISIRGLSCKVGAFHAGAVRAKQTWAVVMLADIRRRVQPPAERQAGA